MKQQEFNQYMIIGCMLIGLGIIGIVFLLIYTHSTKCPPCAVPQPQQSHQPQQLQPPPHQPQHPSQHQQPQIASIATRDRRVLDDPLYPPLNRSTDQDYYSIKKEVRSGNMYSSPTGNQAYDSYHLVGILSSTSQEHPDAGNNQWKLFGRMKDRNQGEYYIIPANNNIDLKIPITNEIVKSERLRDVYSLPQEMRFDSPMLNHTPYIFTELPKGDLTSSSRYL